MKEFVFGTAAQFDWLEALLADGRCHVFEHCVLPPGCTPGTARLGFEKNSSVYILYIDYGIKTTVQDAKFCSLLEQGEVRFVCMQDMVEFLYALQPLFGAAAPSAGAEPDRAQATPPVAEETLSGDFWSLESSIGELPVFRTANGNRCWSSGKSGSSPNLWTRKRSAVRSRSMSLGRMMP